MKAAVYYETGGPEVFGYEDVPDPLCDASGVVIDVGAISIEGGDTLHRAGGEMAAQPHIVGPARSATSARRSRGRGGGEPRALHPTRRPATRSRASETARAARRA